MRFLKEQFYKNSVVLKTRI